MIGRASRNKSVSPFKAMKWSTVPLVFVRVQLMDISKIARKPDGINLYDV